MARDLHNKDYYKGGGLLPINWMSPESLSEAKFTTQSDVWSFGVLIWEIFTYGQRPYYDKKTFSEVIYYICHRKGHLEIPTLCPTTLNNLLLKCWNFHPENRPSFAAILEVTTKLSIDIREEATLPHNCDYARLAENVYLDLTKPVSSGSE